jgi:hypothetical protein
MEHMDKLDVVVDEVKRLLISGGLLVVLVPSNRFSNPVGRLAWLLGDRIWAAYNRLHNHVNLLSEDQWITRLSEHGFGVKLIKPYGGPTVARYLISWDLLSKIHLTSKWPFFTLRHGGNLGTGIIRMVSKTQESRVSALYNCEVARRDQGYWLLLLAQKL